MPRVDEAKYEAMIDALNQFANRVDAAAEEMQALAATSVQAIGSEDKAVGEIETRISQCQQKYAEATAQARSIATAMQEELDEQRKEDEVWESDE